VPRLRSALLLPVLALLCAGGLSACGSSAAPGPKTYDRLDAVSISGAVGTLPKVTWKGQMTAGKIEAKTLVKGTGDALKGEDNVMAQIWIGNGYTKQKAYSTFDDKKAQLLTVNSKLPEFLTAIKGATVGSRIAVTSSASAAFGASGNPSLGIGNKDPVLFVIDLVSAVADGPSGARAPYPDWMPVPTFTSGVPSGFTFDKAPAPTDQLKQVTLLKGTGPVVTTGQSIAVNYLGEVFGGTKPFDESYSKGTPTTFGIGLGQVIKGWDQALVGQTVGSRVVIEVPPALGYGDAGNTQAGIKGTDTLVFVIDILAAG
jgi:peptidylprolyl isomerase